MNGEISQNLYNVQREVSAHGLKKQNNMVRIILQQHGTFKKSKKNKEMQ